jgi:hypothetical protein
LLQLLIPVLGQNRTLHSKGAFDRSRRPGRLSAESLIEKQTGPVECSPGAQEMGVVELKDVVKTFPNLEPRRHPGVGCRAGIAHRVIKQELVGSDLDQQRRKASMGSE